MALKKTSKKKFTRSLDTEGFYTDYDKPESLHAVIVRSPTQAGRIQSITLENLPEGYYLYTANDIPGKKSFKINDFTADIFGSENINYRGEALGILVGPDEGVLNQLLEDVCVNLDVKSLESALKNVIDRQHVKEETANFYDVVDQINDMPSLDTVISKSSIEQESDEIIARREVKYGLYEEKSIAEADSILFDEKYRISSDTWTQKLSSPKWQETEGAFCYVEGKALHVYTPTKWTGLTQKILSSVLSIDTENIYIHKTKNSGVYPTGLWRNTVIAAQTALAAWLSKKPVSLVYSRKEQDLYMKPGVKTKITYKTAIDENAHLKTLKAIIDIDAGYGNPFCQEITDRIALAAANYYKPENLYIRAVAHTSKNPPTSISLKVVDSQAFFAIENEIQKICNKNLILPEEFRLLNSNFDKKSHNEPYPFDIQLENIDKLISSAIKNSDFNRKYASFHMEAIDRIEKNSKPFFALPLRGIGLSTAFISSGYNGTTNFINDTKLEVTLTTEDKLIIHCIKPSDVIQDIWRETASQILQIPKENILIDPTYRFDEIPQNPEDLNNSIGIMNELIKKCCTEIQKKRFHEPLPITSKKNAAKPSKSKWNKDTFTGSPFIAPSSAAAVVEVELDTYTYSEKIKGIWMTIDCGDIYDEVSALRTVRLEIQQELGMLVKGKTVSCDSINIQFIKSNNKTGQIGGLVRNTLPAAFASALSMALTTQLTELPCTEDLLFQLIKNRTRTGEKQ